MYFEIFCMIFMFMLLKFDGFKVIKNTYSRWKNLNGLVSTRHKDSMSIAWISVQMIIQACYINFIQYMNSTIVRLKPGVYEITYVINGRMYKMIVKPQKGPSPVLQISNDLQEDITDKVLPYMGPKYDWHGDAFTPKFFDCETLVFELSDGTEHTFERETHVNVEQ